MILFAKNLNFIKKRTYPNQGGLGKKAYLITPQAILAPPPPSAAGWSL